LCCVIHEWPFDEWTFSSSIRFQFFSSHIDKELLWWQLSLISSNVNNYVEIFKIIFEWINSTHNHIYWSMHYLIKAEKGLLLINTAFYYLQYHYIITIRPSINITVSNWWPLNILRDIVNVIIKLYKVVQIGYEMAKLAVICQCQWPAILCLYYCYYYEVMCFFPAVRNC